VLSTGHVVGYLRYLPTGRTGGRARSGEAGRYAGWWGPLTAPRPPATDHPPAPSVPLSPPRPNLDGSLRPLVRSPLELALQLVDEDKRDEQENRPWTRSFICGFRSRSRPQRASRPRDIR